jgi:hypothetical protein
LFYSLLFLIIINLQEGHIQRECPNNLMCHHCSATGNSKLSCVHFRKSPARAKQVVAELEDKFNLPYCKTEYEVALAERIKQRRLDYYFGRNLDK